MILIYNVEDICHINNIKQYYLYRCYDKSCHGNNNYDWGVKNEYYNTDRCTKVGSDTLI